MSLNILSTAKYVYDVDSDLNYVEIIYDKWNNKSMEYNTYTDYLNTQPVGDWSQISWNYTSSSDYYKFLDAMVVKTIEVLQRMAELFLDQLLYTKHDPRFYVRLINSIKILDPTFQPPRIDMGSAWQVDFVTKFSKKYIPGVIQTSISKKRLVYFISVMQQLT
jgi:hypothetical protein|tara:strand:- start:58 stop:546 length:489 start_codon:yes stop_codon:yes gene_type:complete